ncbi:MULTISPECIES: hypothetical protein [Aerococcus]|uniref:hypothetical protein n=1 Tax=Aerococcus TaxID=1375 RepID=UPI0018A775B0|nr:MULTISPECIES: hypothetical protein [Aerococcus]MCY3067609.1 hypothetical protein [Aerococcus mictus]MCY3080489.1 hypothetical protein [Aerococcus mictus]MDK8484552.1 hypothetical protein [Aerococcus urinae]
MKNLIQKPSFIAGVIALLVASVCFNGVLAYINNNLTNEVEKTRQAISVNQENKVEKSSDKDQLIKSLEEENKKLKESKNNQQDENTKNHQNSSSNITSTKSLVEDFIKNYEELSTQRPDYDKQIPKFKPLVTENLLKQLFPEVPQNQMAMTEDEINDHNIFNRSIDNISIFMNEEELQKEEPIAMAKVTITTHIENAKDRNNTKSKIMEIHLKKVDGQLKVDSFSTNFL